MAGFLDKKERVLDVCLTNTGRRLLSEGKLKFCYWSAFDDEVDYDPFIAESGSLTAAQMSSSIERMIEETPVREAVSGYRDGNRLAQDFTNVRCPLFDRPQGQLQVPRAVFPPSGEYSFKTLQRRVKKIFQTKDKTGHIIATNPDSIDLGVERFDSTSFSLRFGYEQGSIPSDATPEGFFMRVFRSGSEGLREVDPRRDASGQVCFNNDLTVLVGSKE